MTKRLQKMRSEEKENSKFESEDPRPQKIAKPSSKKYERHQKPASKPRKKKKTEKKRWDRLYELVPLTVENRTNCREKPEITWRRLLLKKKRTLSAPSTPRYQRSATR